MEPATQSPNEEAQALISEVGLAEARSLVETQAELADGHYQKHVAQGAPSHVTNTALQIARFWQDTAALLRLETQDDDSWFDGVDRIPY